MDDNWEATGCSPEKQCPRRGRGIPERCWSSRCRLVSFHQNAKLYSPNENADELKELRAWFNENLEKPTSFGRGKLRLGFYWFKTDATEHISRIWQMVQLLERNGIYVKKIRTDRPGYVIYEDEWQLVAEPFRKGTMPRK
jgi:hypothetical protein